METLFFTLAGLSVVGFVAYYFVQDRRFLKKISKKE